MRLLRRRNARPSAEATAAIAAATRDHQRALAELHDAERREPEVEEARQLLEAHNEANHWQQWLFEVMSPTRRSA